MSNFFKYNIFVEKIDTLVSNIESHITNESNFKYLSCLNPHSFIESLKNNNFYSSLKFSTWMVPDGVGIVLGYFFLNYKKISRITGYDVFINLSHQLNHSGNFNIFFLGSTDKNLSKIKAKYTKKYPNLKVVGMHSPPFKAKYTNNDLKIIKSKINDSNADVLWVGLTAPKQELLMFNLKDDLNVSFAAGIGAVFDYYTSNVIHPPLIVRKICLEWLFRFVQEPLRLFKRNFISSPFFILLILKEKMKTKLK